MKASKENEFLTGDEEQDIISRDLHEAEYLSRYLRQAASAKRKESEIPTQFLWPLPFVLGGGVVHRATVPWSHNWYSMNACRPVAVAWARKSGRRYRRVLLRFDGLLGAQVESRVEQGRVEAAGLEGAADHREGHL